MKKLNELVEKAMNELVECMNDKDIEIDSDTLGFICEDLVNHNEENDMSNEEFAKFCTMAYSEAEKRGLIE